MASHVVVVDTTARKYTVKTTPTKYLSDVLQEACTKFGISPDQYTLKHNNKQVDLSRTIRLAGLSAGAKLQLVQVSRSPSVVSVALQLPPDWATSNGPTRLTDKFPSNTSIWQILRKFEAGVAGDAASRGSNLNFTQRATAQVQSGQSGSGRLFYEMPQVNVMGRDLASLSDLQKTLAQLGLNSGNCLLRLSFRNMQQPLEEAMSEISQYFTEVEETNQSEAGGVHTDAKMARAEEPSASITQEGGPTREVPQTTNTPHPPGNDAGENGIIEAPTTASQSETMVAPSVQSSSNGVTSSEISIFAPPSHTTPASARSSNYNENDYVPTIDHAKYHQARLASESRNKKLLSDAEIEAEQQNRATALSEIREVVVRLRFPDQSQAQKSFGQDASTSDLYSTCRDLMARPKNEGFTIRVANKKGAPTTLQDGNQRLILDLGWQGRILVTVVWNEDVGMDTRRQPSLKEEHRQKAERLNVDLPPMGEESMAGTSTGVTSAQSNEQSTSGNTGDKEAKFKRFLKGLSKK